MDGIQKIFFTNEPIKGFDYYQTTNTSFFKSNIMKTLLCNLKILYIKRAPLEKEKLFNLDQNLNQLKNLEQLQIDRIKVRKGYTLDLPKLKILSIGYLYSTSHERFSIDCPNLYAFEAKSNILKFCFKYPKNITHLKFYSLFRYEDEISKFRNLEYLIYDSPKDTFNQLHDLKEHRNLKELHFKKDTKNLVQQCFEQKTSNNLSFEIYYVGLNVETKEEIEQYAETINSKEKTDKTEFYALNYSKTSDLIDFVFEIDYTILTSKLEGVPKNFFNKFINIFKVTVSNDEKGTDQSMFVDFIRRLKHLRFLDIDVSFDQSFYNSLYIYSPFLNRLDVKETKVIDINFLSDLKQMQRFKINQKIPIDKIVNTFEILDNFKYLTIVKNKKEMVLRGNYYSTTDGLESFFKFDGKEILFENVVMMIKFFKNLENVKKDKVI